MATAGEIKVVLQLDDSGFSVKTKKAKDITDALAKSFVEANKSSKETEKGIAALGSKLDSTAGEVGALTKTLAGIKDSFENLRYSLDSSVKQISGFRDALGNLGAKRAGREIELFSKETAKLKENLAMLKPSLKETAEGYGALAKAQEKATRVAREAADEQKITNDQRLRNEIETNEKIIASKRQYAAQLTNQSARARNEIDLEAKALEDVRRRLGEYGGKRLIKFHEGNINAKMGNLALFEGEIEDARRLIVELQEQNRVKRIGIQLIEEETAKYAQEDAARREAMRYITQSNERRIDDARRVGQVEREEISHTTEMLKGMAELWAASKIDHGLMSSVHRAGDYQRQVTLLDGMNLPGNERNQVISNSDRIARQLGFVNQGQVLAAYRGALGIVGRDNPSVLSDSLPTALMAARSVAFAAGDMSPESINNNLLNIIGFAKSRGQLSAAGIRDNADFLQKMAVATGGKMTLADMEMIAKRNLGGMPYVSDAGFAQEVALAEELKTSGHNGGGGGNSGAGVSLLGSSMAMIQKMMEGGLKTKEAAKTLAAMGVINMDTFDPVRAGSRIQALRQAGLTMGDMSMKTPVMAIQKFVEAAMAYMTNDKNRKHYFGAKDIHNQEARSLAMARLATEMGFSKSVVQWLENVANPDVFKNTQNLTKQMLGAKGVNAQNAAIDKTYVGNVQQFNASLQQLEITLGKSVLPMVTEFVKSLNSVVREASDFAANHKFLAELTMIGGAIGSLVMGIKGFKTMFGIVGDLRTGMAMLAGKTAQAGEAAIGSRLKFTEFGTAVRTKALAAALEFTTGGLGGIGRGFLNVGSLLGTVGGQMVKFMALAPQVLAAWDIGYAIGTMIEGWLDKVKIGVHSITDEIGHALDWIGTKLGNVTSSQADVLRRDYQMGVTSQLGGFGSGELSSAMSQVAQYLNSPDPKTRAAAHEIIQEEARRQRQLLASKDIHYRPGSHPAKPHPAAHAQDNTSVSGFNYGSTKVKRAPEDLFTQAYGNLANADRTIKAKIAALMSGKPRDYNSEARSYVLQQLMSGEYDKGHNANYRDHFLKSGFHFDAATGHYLHNGKIVSASDAVNFKAVGENGKTLAQMADEKASILKNVDAYNALTFATQRASAAKHAATIAAQQLATNGLGKETQAMRALLAEFAREAAKNPAAANSKQFHALQMQAMHYTAASEADNLLMDLRSRGTKIDTVLGKYGISSNSLVNAGAQLSKLHARQQAVIGSKASPFKKTVEEWNLNRRIENIYNHATTGKAGAISTEDLKKLKGELLPKSEEQKLNAVIASLELDLQNFDGTATGLKQWQNNAARLQSLLKFRDRNNNIKAAITEKQTRTPIQALTDSWRAIGTAGNDTINKQAAGWANSLLGAIQNGVTTGHFRDGLRSAFAGVLTDVQHDLIKKLIATPMENMITQMAGAATSVVGMAPGPSTAGAPSMLGGLGSMLSSGVGWLGSLFGNNGTGAYTLAGQAFNNPSAYVASGAAGAASAASGGMLSSIGSWFSHLFADGGVMTEFGPMQLRKYANGGIANSPQLAVFGEGSMNEAYVPLPDGRSIPVTMNHNASSSGQSQTSSTQGGGVSINIVVNGSTGTSSSSSSGDASGAWTSMAHKVKQVVQQEMITQQRPGGILYK